MTATKGKAATRREEQEREARAAAKRVEAERQAALVADPLLREPAVRLVTGSSTSCIYRWIAEGKFPKPVKVGGTISAWPRSAIESWIAAVVAGREWQPTA